MDKIRLYIAHDKRLLKMHVRVTSISNKIGFSLFYARTPIFVKKAPYILQKKLTHFIRNSSVQFFNTVVLF